MSSNDGISSNKEEDDTLNNDLTSVSPEETLIHGAGDGNSGGIIKTLSEATKEETVGTKPGDSIMKSITETSKGSGDCTASKEDSTTEKVLITEDKAEQEKKTVSDIEMEEDDLESWVDDEDNILTSDNESGKKDSENNEDLNHEARIEVKSPETKADSGINEENCLENSSKDSNEAMDVDNTSDEAKEISESDDNNAKTQVKSLATEADTDLPKDDKPDSQEAVEQRDIKNVGKTSLMPVKTTVDDNNLSIDNNKLVNYNDSINISMDSPIQINTDHHLNRPDVMLEIPTHELIDIDEVLDSPDVTNVDDDKIDDSEIGDDNAVVDSTEDQGDQVVQDMAVEGDQINDKSQDMAVEESINDKNVIQVGNDTSEKRPCDVSAEVVTSKASTIEDVQPSTSTGFMKMTPDTSGEVPEMSDSLGLLAESCRVRDDDEEQDYDEDADDDDDYDPDESSNQVSAEHSDDSNTPTRDEEERELEEREIEETEEVDYKCAEMFEFTMNNIDGTQTEVEETVVMKTEVKTEISGYSSEITTPILPEITTGVQELKVKEEKGVTIEEKNKKDLTPAVKETPEDGVIPMDQIKKEPTDAVKPKARIIGPRVEAVKDAGDTPVSARSSTISNDDVIEQPIFIETFKVSDDEDDLEPSPKEPVESEEKKIKTKEDEEIVEESMTEEQKIESQELPTPEPSKSPKTSPVKLKKLSITSIQNESVVSYVDLEESSSEDDEKVPKKHSCLRSLLQTPIPIETGNLQSQPEDVTTVNLPPEIEVMSTSGGSGNTSEIVVKEGEVVISGVPKPPPLRPARLNTSEVTIKTTSGTETTLIIPSTKMNESTKFDQNKTSSTQTAKPKLGLEIFSLDSDDDETAEAPKETPEVSPEKKYKKKKCINEACKSGVKIFKLADNLTASYYDAKNKKRPLICLSCVEESAARNQRLIASIKSMTPILELELTNSSLDLVEILDSDSEEEDTQPPQEPEEAIGEETAKFVEENLAAILNETWKKYNLDDRLKENKKGFDAEIEKLEKESKELDQMFEECQRATDKLRYDFYATFEHQIQELPSLHIYDTPEFNYMGPELGLSASEGTRQNAKRKVSSPMEIAAKRPAIPLGYAPLNEPSSKQEDTKNIDNNDDIDISVVKLSAEAAPHDLPPLGEQTRSPLYVGMTVFAMRNSFGPWVKAKILEVIPKGPGPGTFTMCRIQYDNKMKNNIKLLPARCLAYTEPPNARLTIGTRVIALFKDINKRESYYNGVIAEMPTPVNSYRYMVFFDDGYSQYVPHPFTRLVCECSPQVWEEVHPMSREFVRKYIAAYPERPMVRVHQGQEIEAEWNDKWWRSRILKVDASIALVEFIGADRKEWIYRGSNRLGPLFAELKAAERHRPRPMPRSKRLRSNMPYVEYTRSEEPTLIKPTPVPTPLTQQQQYEEIRRQRAVAKKSTAIGSLPASAQNLPPAGPGPTPRSLDSDTSRVVYYTPKNAIKPYKYVPHKCTPKCKRNDVLSLKELRTYNPLAKPLLSGWERQICRFKGQKEVMYRAPCGRRLRNMKELHRYLRMTESELPVDLFDFYHATHCLAEFVLNKCLVGKKDLSHGKENVPVPCVNYYDDSLPEFCSYNTERTPTSGVPLNLDPEFLCGCDCTDDCQDKTKCACWKMTLEGARTIGLEGPNIGYEFKRLPEPLPSGIYECNSRCKCKETCLNRVAQHPLQLKLQVFKTLKRGWGIRALNDVPKGAFLCVYAGNLLTDATANLDGLNEGDEYLAELDYIEVVEQMKEGYEEDIPEADKKLDKQESIKKEEPVEESSSSSEEDDKGSKTDKEDDDFRPGHIGLGVMEFNKRLRRRDRKKKEEQQNKEEAEKDRDSKDSNIDDDCITISDDEEIREPSRFAAQPGMGGNDFISKYKSVRTLFGEDEACYIMDAKVQGNIGRYLNHSCSPNVFVQNVFVDTHDPRFPWVAFFALSHINAGTELTWNYNYDVGSVPGKVLYCYCEAPNCRGRLL